jgi:hypothetical protein
MLGVFTAYISRSHVHYGMYTSESHDRRIAANVRLNNTFPEVFEARNRKNDLQFTQSVYTQCNSGSLPRATILS